MIIENISSLSDGLYYYKKILETKEEIIVLDFRESEFIRNNYLSIIGLALHIKKHENKKIEIHYPKKLKIQNILQSSGFLLDFVADEDTKISSNSSIVKYTNIKLNDWDSLGKFYNYFELQLNKRVNNLSPELSNKITQKIFELFSNVFRHSQSKFGFFCSGQFYDDKFYFTIVDGGVTIKYNVNKYLKKLYDENKGLKKILTTYKEINALKSIKWSLEDTNSTTGEGGLGLSLVRELIIKSKGTLDIISGNGHYTIRDAKEFEQDFDFDFRGTVISIGLNTSMNNYYSLKEGK